MIVNIIDVDDVEFLNPIHGEPALLVPVRTESGQSLELRFDTSGSRKLWQFLTALAELEATSPEVKPLGEPLN